MTSARSLSGRGPGNSLTGMRRIVAVISLASALHIGGATAGFAQQPDPDCGRWAETPGADPATWPKLTKCGTIGGQALAKVPRAEAVRADTNRLSGLEQALRQIQDSSVFRAALEVARDSTAPAAARIVAISIALGQFDRMIVRRPSSGFAPILAGRAPTRREPSSLATSHPAPHPAAEPRQQRLAIEPVRLAEPRCRTVRPMDRRLKTGRIEDPDQNQSGIRKRQRPEPQPGELYRRTI